MIIILSATSEKPEHHYNSIGKLEYLFEYDNYTKYCGCHSIRNTCDYSNISEQVNVAISAIKEKNLKAEKALITKTSLE